MPRNTRMYIRKAAALLLVLSLLCFGQSVEAETISSVRVRSAVLDADTITADGMVRVYLASLGNPTLLNLTIDGGYKLGATGEYLSDGTEVTVQFNSSSGVISFFYQGRTVQLGQHATLRRYSADSSHGVRIHQARESKNPYPGDLEFRAVYGNSGYQLYLIAHVYIENYLYGVLPYEMGNSSNIEALKAQAVAARTYTVRMMKNRASGLYDVKDTTSDQVYRGTPSGNANCVAAIDATKGIVLMYGSSYITTYYSSSNGGQTETSRTGTSYAYLPVKDDPFDYANPGSSLRKKVIYSNLQSTSNSEQLITLLKNKAVSKLNQMGYAATYSNISLGTLNSVTPHTPKYASPSRLYTKMDFCFSVSADGINTTVTVTCDIFGELESILSLSLQSSANELWSVAKTGSHFEIQARRYGHGMGMSQRGAMYMAKLGYSYDQILGFYYEGCTRVKHSFTHTFLAPSGEEHVNVETPAEDENESNPSCYATVKLASNGATLAIRNTKSYSGLVIGAISNGARVEVLYSDGAWALVRFGDICGYVPVSSIVIAGTPVGSDTGATGILGFSKVTANDFVNLRQSAGMDGKILGTAPAGAVLTVFSVSGNWAKVQHNALAAYVNTGYISPVSQNYPGENLSTGSSSAAVKSADGGYVNLRAEASTNAQILTSLAPGTMVTVLFDDGSWSYITAGSYSGYIMSSFLDLSDQNAGEENDEPSFEESIPENSVRAIVATQTGALNMRALPQTGSQILAAIPRGTEIHVTERGTAWCGVYYAGQTGYVMASYLSFIGEGEENTQQPEKTGRAFVATPGGTLNLRLYPQTGSEILFQIPQGASVNVHEFGTDWCGISYQGMTGYVMTIFLSFDEMDNDASQNVPETEAVMQAIVSTQNGGLNLRQQPSQTAVILTLIPQYSQIDVLEYGQNWSKVIWRDLTGYVMSSYLTIKSSDGESGVPESNPAVSTTQTAYVRTTSGTLNLRAEPSSLSQVLFGIPQNTEVKVLSYGDAWSYVSYADITGYVMTQYLSFETVSEPQPDPNIPDNGVNVWVNTDSGSLNMRSAASTDAQVLVSIPQYAQLISYGVTNEWAYVSYQGYRGYVMSRYLAAGMAPTQVENTVSTRPVPSVVDGMDTSLRVPSEATYAVSKTGQDVTLWETCSETGKALRFIGPFEQVEIILIGEIWCCVEYQGMQGYCRTEYLSVIE